MDRGDVRRGGGWIQVMLGGRGGWIVAILGGKGGWIKVTRCEEVCRWIEVI